MVTSVFAQSVGVIPYLTKLLACRGTPLYLLLVVFTSRARCVNSLHKSVTRGSLFSRMSPTRADGLRPGPSATLPRFAAAKAACRRACPCVRHPGQALPSSARATSFSTAVALSTRQQESLYCTLGPGVTWVTFKCSVTALRHVCGVRVSSSCTVALKCRVPVEANSMRTSHSCMSPARELMLSTAVGRGARLWLRRLSEQRLDHTSSAGCSVGHGLAVHGRRDPRCIFKHS